MDWINKKIVVLAVVLSLVTTGFVFAYINSFTKSTSAGELVRIYVASKTLQERSKINITDIKSVEIDKKYLQNGALIRKDQIIGKRVNETILQGEQIIKDRITQENQTSLAYKIPKGKRAVSIDITEASDVAYYVQPGDYVDIAATFAKDEVTEATRKVEYPKVTKIILQDILVLAVGTNNQQEGKDVKKDTPKTVTLAVDANDAEKLIYSSEDASLRLILRPLDEKEILNTDGKVRAEVSGTKGSIILPN